MNLPAEFVIHRRLLEHSLPSKLIQLGCPEYLRIDVSWVIESWAKCFRGCREPDQLDVISVDRLLFAADFSIVQLYNERGCIPKAKNYELWYWLIFVAQKILSKNSFFSMNEKLQSPEFCVQLATWTGYSVDTIRREYFEM